MNSETNRRLYVAALVATTTALLLFRFFAIPRWNGAALRTVDVAAAVTDSLLGGAIATLGLSVLVLWLYRTDAERLDEAVVVEPRDIASEIKKAAETTASWTYRGHTGRYFRSAVLPLLIARSAQHGRYISICVQILDPDDEARIDYFVKYRRSLNPEKVGYWTVPRAQSEILATVVALTTASALNPRISCRVFVGGVVSPFTIDMADSVAVVTRESAALGALKHPAGSTFFDSMVEDLHLGREQSRELRVLGASAQEPHNSEQLRIMLEQVGVGSTIDDGLLGMTLEAINNPINPYPNG